MAAGSCSECGTSLADKKAGTKTCSRSCREKRSRRLARVHKEAGSKSPYPPEVQAVAKAARDEARDVAKDLTREALLPVVREALTEDVLRSLQGMVALVPDAIANIKEGLQSADQMTKDRYTELVMRYTLGHKSIAPPTADQVPPPMTVVLNVPGSGADPQVALTAAPALDAEADELRECVDCHRTKVAAEFVASSERCQECHDELTAAVHARFATNPST